MKSLLTWLDDRTGVRGLIRSALFENIPGGSKWRYVWGSTLVFTFMVQLITGLFLWMAYGSSSTTAWESTFYIQNEMQGGWLLRGIHHYTAQAMVVLLAIHLIQVVIDRAYRAPREINFWLGLVLMLIVLGLSLTGYLLPWDQKGYWATKVATNLMSIVPLVGEDLQKLVVGGPDYGHHTLTRFFGLHAGILPGLLIVFLVLHIGIFRRHGIKAHRPELGQAEFFWPKQILKDGIASLVVMGVVLFLIFLPGMSGDHTGQSLGEYLGADLGAPADAGKPYDAARPEWYFLFLFQFLKLFEGMGESGEFLGAIVIPGVVVGLLFVMPILGKWKLGHRFNLGVLATLVLGVVILTVLAKVEDNQNDDYRKAVAEADEAAKRATKLASHSRPRIPVEGAAWMLRNDPAALFRKHCGSCHDHFDPTDPDATENIVAERFVRPEIDKQTGEIIRDDDGKIVYQPSGGSNLFGFASRKWLTGLLDPEMVDLIVFEVSEKEEKEGSQKKVLRAPYFGNTIHARHSDRMVDYVKNVLSDESAEDIQKIILALSAEAKLKSQKISDEESQADILIGRDLINSNCIECHRFHGDGPVAGEEDNAGPDLTGYGSEKWLVEIISDPERDRFYAGNIEEGSEEDGTPAVKNNDRMPIFCSMPLLAGQNTLTPRQIRLISMWLRSEFWKLEDESKED